MSTLIRLTAALPAMLLTVSLLSCDNDKKEVGATPSARAAPTMPVPTVPASSAAPVVAKPSHACPDGSTGEGTQENPCVAKGTTRIMEVTWTGKITDKGPSFRIVNKSDLEILYGQIAVYFYDKAGKQLTVPGGGDGEGRPKQKCSGNIFAGPMKPGEKAVLWFSCVDKKHVPEGTVAIEGEMQMVGFTAEGGGKTDTYWRNEGLAPDVRPKGGIK